MGLTWGSGEGARMLFSLLVNPLTGKDLDWADPSKHPSDPALGKAVINKCFAEYGDEDMVKECVGEFAMFLPRYQSAGTPH